MSRDVQESDWKTFRERLPEWRERYLEEVTDELADQLGSGESTPTERFWKAKERIEEEADILRDCLDGCSRSNMKLHLLLMYGHGLVRKEDLDLFSEDLRAHIIEVAEEGSTGSP